MQGPSAAVAAVSAAVILPIVGADAMGTDDAVPVTAALAIVTGVLYLCLGVARMGWVSSFLSKAVMSGFVLGFSIGIIIDQSYKLLGVPSTDGSYWDKLIGTIKELPNTDRTTFVLGSISLAALLAMRRFAPKLPRALIVVVVSTLAVTALDLVDDGVAVTGPVPTGLFDVQFPWGNFQEQGALIVGALSIIFVGYSETLASARAMANKHGYRIDADQELLAEGFAAVGAGLMGSYVTDGSLSKTSVADAAGQRTQMASLINAVFVLLTMLVLASLFENLASAVLGAVVIDAMVGLITFEDLRRYYRVNRADWAAFMAAGLGIIFFSITAGIAVGVVVSLLLLIGRASRPALRRIGRDPRSNTYHDVERHDDVEIDRDVLVLRLDGPLFFANADRFRESLNETLTASDPRPGAVVVDMEAVSYTDTDGADVLGELAGQMADHGVWFGVARAESAITRPVDSRRSDGRNRPRSLLRRRRHRCPNCETISVWVNQSHSEPAASSRASHATPTVLRPSTTAVAFSAGVGAESTAVCRVWSDDWSASTSGSSAAAEAFSVSTSPSTVSRAASSSSIPSSMTLTSRSS